MKLSLISKAIKNQIYLQEIGEWREKIQFTYDFGKITCPKCEGKGKQEDQLCDRCGGEKEIPSFVNVDLLVEDNRTLFKCSCAHHSTNEMALCQYTLGVIFFLFKKELRRLRKKW